MASDHLASATHSLFPFPTTIPNLPINLILSFAFGDSPSTSLPRFDRLFERAATLYPFGISSLLQASIFCKHASIPDSIHAVATTETFRLSA
ncbi:hypothetical protein NCS52_00086400 [Fusarium sp. LHS14.1]|nr:hypothetical protein NCS52_00086400 [Fusarium sp. LHS14.1]